MGQFGMLTRENGFTKEGKHMKRWVNVELAKETAGRFKEYCRDYHIKFETSDCFNLIHFECLMDDMEIAKANDFIAARC
ncbi:hypothetical protein SAMN04490370_11656 [Eubacterium ruminantium]|uniref:Uncharacterized protein n=2 Tax=Eubacterium ruminantium TaxID=42322 RepID=A0A1T4Q5C7_9FIRM|nr:hypothetical protein SAMN04490370_11656 [Eubacterium ruminantium]SJZ98929.1 hypothetical protein SAMN02745110_02269 [Eubacterium ruminantium]